MAFDFHKEYTIKNAYFHIHEDFMCDDKRDRDFVPECVKTSIGFVRGFYYDESEETIFLIVKNADGEGVHYEDIKKVPTDDAFVCAEKILANSFALKVNREHELYVGEKVYDNDAELVCEVVKIDGNKVLVSQEKYVEHNKANFDMDCDQDPMEWVADAESLYQFAEGVVDAREENPVCYEHTSMDYPFFSPYLYENLYTFEVRGLSDEEIKALSEKFESHDEDEAQVKITILVDKNKVKEALHEIADTLSEDCDHYETSTYDVEVDWEYE